MFKRSNKSYDIDYNNLKLKSFLNDEASPLINIIKLIPDNSTVLDIGAGNGLLGWLFLKLQRDIIIDGIEPSKYAAKIAKPFYRKFYCEYLENIEKEINYNNYDYIILADVIEHIYDPLEFLQHISQKISKKTKIIVSIPNVAHGSIRLALLNGEFEYVESGILEKTHIRFFTLKTIEKLVSKLKINIHSIFFLKKHFFLSFKGKYKPSLFTKILLYFDNLANTYQFLIVLGHGTYEKKTFYRGTAFYKLLFNKLK